MIVLGLIVAWQIYTLYVIHSMHGTTFQYIGWGAWTATALGILYLVGGFN
jgi:hypothetical protein